MEKAESGVFSKTFITRRLVIKPHELKSNISLLLKKKLNEQISGKCIKDGYIRPNTIEIQTRPRYGNVIVNSFSGDVIYDVGFTCDVCNPSLDMQFVCKVVNKNRIGLIAESYINEDERAPLTIIVAYQHHDNRKKFESIKINSDIIIKVIGSRFSIGDSRVNVVGKLIDVIKS
jgi:DNA-directed RNA polymerase subunit E'/Rpb7